MKRSAFLLLVAVLFSGFVKAQDGGAQATEDFGDVPTTMTYVAKTSTITKFHTQVELEKYGKLELTTLYMERVLVLTDMLPYLALSPKPAGATLKDMGVPSTKSNVAHLEKEVKSKEIYVSHLKETLHDVTPYADKQKIIWCILFLEQTIHNVEKTAIKD